MDKKLLLKISTPVLMFLIMIDMVTTQIGLELGAEESNWIALIMSSVLGISGLWVSSIMIMFAILGVSYINRNKLDTKLGMFWLASLIAGIILRIYVIYTNYVIIR